MYAVLEFALFCQENITLIFASIRLIEWTDVLFVHLFVCFGGYNSSTQAYSCFSA